MAFELILSSLYCQWVNKETKENKGEILIELELKILIGVARLQFQKSVHHVGEHGSMLSKEPRVLHLAGNRKASETLIKA